MGTAFARGMWPALDTQSLARIQNGQLHRWQQGYSATGRNYSEGKNINFSPETAYSLQHGSQVMKT